MFRTLIIDDEENNRLRLKQIIYKHFPHIQVVGEADGVENGLMAITNFNPDIVLLDIKMADGDAFDLLNKVISISFKIIFITAYEEYALKAIKFSALDYLLKPVSVEDLKSAFYKAENQILTDLKLQVSNLQNNLRTTKNKTLALKTSEKIYLLDVNDIIRCEADRNYTYLFVNEQKKHIASQPMKEFEDILKEFGFIRIHKSHLINMAFIESFDKSDGGYVILKDKTELPVSRRKKNELLTFFSKL
ncbi:MAG: response regulator transcription factor [Bacteroidetes bacterium]|nr:response regulator transcription factor [Bacteroidota bacterium]